MPRAKRHLVNGGIYHIMIRGVNKQVIFKDDDDRKMFIRIMNYCNKKYECEIYAYCLMNNHVHILFKDKEFFVSDFMQYVASIYAEEFNKKYKRVGHLFQDRFKSIYVYNDNYLLRLIRYIHRNPERAGICKTEEYKWNSYKEYVYNSKIIETDSILKMFDSKEKIAIKKFKEFVADSGQENLDKIYMLEKLNDEEAEKLIKDITKIDDIYQIKNYNRKYRREIVNKILEVNNLNFSQISRVLGIGKNFKNQIK